ncbi:RNA-directed DNA polymerase from mobile element jockey [Trichonephila clavipes]|nr:RNA-directed DNA polymerase from mobile element jockey [Trichonephila clavipes]
MYIDNGKGLPQEIIKIVKPHYMKLCDKHLLNKCLHGKTQNANEGFTGILWKFIPKDIFVELQTLRLGAHMAVIQFNKGFRGLLDVLNQAQVQVGAKLKEPHSDKSFQTVPQVFDRFEVRTISWPGQQPNYFRTTPVFPGVVCASLSEVVFLKLFGIGNSAFLLAAAFAYLFTRILAPDSVENRLRELINLRDSYAIWAGKLSIVPATSDEYAATSAELGNIHTALLATKTRMNLPLFRLPTSIKALDALIKKVEEQRAHLTPVDSTPKETVPFDTTLNSPSKRTLKNLRLKTDKKRLIDDDGFQTPDKRHTANKIDKKTPSLPPTTSQTSNPVLAPPSPAESNDSEIEDEDAGKSNATDAGTPKNCIPPIFVKPPDNWCTLISITRQLAPTLISKLTDTFLRITVQSDDEYRKLAQFLRHEGVEYKSFALKSDRPLKLLIHGLPTSSKVEEMRAEIEREGFQIHKISQLQKFKTKAPMPLIYLQLINYAKADSIFQFTEMSGTQISFERYDNSRNKRPKQCWRGQSFLKSTISQLNALNAQGLTRLKTVIMHLKTH